MKRISILILTVIAATLSSCLPTYDIEPPVLTVSYTEDDIIYFSEIQTASLNVNIHSKEAIVGFQMRGNPPFQSVFTRDSIFPQYCHNVNFNVNITYPNVKIQIAPDSVYQLEFLAYTENDSATAKRTLKYKYRYPEIDSFDITLSSDIYNGLCLLDIQNKTAYKYSEYKNHNFDLVYINPFGINNSTQLMDMNCSFASPDAAFLQDYFEVRAKDIPYLETSLGFRTTECGRLSYDDFSWDKINEKAVGEEGRWQYEYLNDNIYFGYGLSSLGKDIPYKFKLYDNSYAMIRILSQVLRTDPNSSIDIRVYYQK